MATGRIVVGLEGSEGARKALGWAVEEARLRGAKLVALHAWSAPLVAPAPALLGAPPPLDTETLERIRVGAEQLLEHEVDAVDLQGVDVERLVVEGSAADALLDAARDADLLVVGTRGLGGFTGLLLGSVSQQVSHHAPCPVVIVPPPRSG
jgi:nucleotide-binding universal stress UspA family protein